MPHTQDTTAFSSGPEPAFYRLADVIRITALSRSSIYRRIAAGEFPPQVSLGGRAKGWRREALRAWIGDPTGFRPLATCEVKRSSLGALVRHVAATEQGLCVTTAQGKSAHNISHESVAEPH